MCTRLDLALFRPIFYCFDKFIRSCPLSRRCTTRSNNIFRPTTGGRGPTPHDNSSSQRLIQHYIQLPESKHDRLQQPNFQIYYLINARKFDKCAENNNIPWPHFHDDYETLPNYILREFATFSFYLFFKPRKEPFDPPFVQDAGRRIC